jgi:hypothetical protein
MQVPSHPDDSGSILGIYEDARDFAVVDQGDTTLATFFGYKRVGGYCNCGERQEDREKQDPFSDPHGFERTVGAT